jgi:hypothetical protein
MITIFSYLGLGGYIFSYFFDIKLITDEKMAIPSFLFTGHVKRPAG